LRNDSDVVKEATLTPEHSPRRRPRRLYHYKLRL
jgi:hypothetical protein